MKIKQLTLTFLIAVTVLYAFGQKNFNRGYIVDNANVKTDCWIQNVGNAESSSGYVYRLNEKSEITAVLLAKIKEFGTKKDFKCIRALIAVDISNGNISRPEDAGKGPEWDEGHAYLKVLVEGELATLYSYFTEGKKLFYYSVGDSTIQPLQHKEYNLEVAYGVVEKIYDNSYREQLMENVACGDTKKLETLAYTKKSLIKYFEDFHKCKDADIYTYELSQHQKGKFALKAGVSFNRMDMSAKDLKAGSSIFFTKESSIGYGIEAEYVFAFNNYKWSVFTESNYYNYYSDYSTNSYNSNHDGFVVDYSTIEIPIGVCHYMYLNPENRFFVKVAYVPHIILDGSNIKFNSEATYELAAAPRTFAGIGYSYKRLNCEARFYSKQNITQNLYQRGSDYSQFSVRLSYTLLK